jgi:transposase-like protein
VGAVFSPLVIDAAWRRRYTPGDRWFAHETYVKVTGRLDYVYQTIDQFG